MNILVVGGAGYIGSHMVRMLTRKGHDVVVLDNLSTGFAESVKSGELIVGDMSDQALVESILGDRKIEAVMHFAAHALVGESVAEPQKYYRNNVIATLSLLDARPEGRYADWCAERNVGLLCYGTIAGGFLTERWLGVADPGYAFENRSLIKYRLIIDDFGGWDLLQTERVWT